MSSGAPLQDQGCRHELQLLHPDRANGRIKRGFKIDTDGQFLSKSAESTADRVRHLPRDDLKILLQGHADAGAADNDVDGFR